jgi:peptide/nickel transport system ATP-binding protein
MSSTLLEVRDLCVSFRTAQGIVQAVDHVSFTINPGEILGIVGESGSGKTLTVQSILGLIDDPNAMIEGSIKLRDRELIGLSQHAWRSVRGREISMIFQDPMTALTPVYTVGWQIIEQIRAHRQVSSSEAHTRAAALLDAVGIADAKSAMTRYPHQLSGGMRQRVMIAMALSCNPALLLADEPTTALDVTVQAQILDLIRNLRRDFGSSVILITHNMGVVAEIADRAMVMYAGRIVESASIGEIFADPHHPYAWGLLGSIPPLTGPRPHRLPAIAGLPPSLLDLPKGCAFAPRCQWQRAACATRPPLQGQAGHLAACVLSPAERAAVR